MQASVFDISKYILKCQGKMTKPKLHRLLFYCKAWCGFFDDAELFKEKLEAWASGPICPKLWEKHKNFISEYKDFEKYKIKNIKSKEKDTINKVLAEYGKLDGQQLTDISTQEQSYIRARKNVEGLQRGGEIIMFDMVEDMDVHRCWVQGNPIQF